MKTKASGWAAALALLMTLSCAQAFGRRPAIESALDLSPLQSGQLVIWVSARGRYDSAALGASFASDFPKTRLVQIEIPPESFIGRVRAKPPDLPTPDVAFADNYFQVQPLLEMPDVWLSWGRPRFDTFGWWMIFKDTKRLSKARAFVRWLSRSPAWTPATNTTMSSAAIETVQKISTAAVDAMRLNDQPKLEAQLDNDAARMRAPQWDRRARVSDVRPIFTFGNARFAFVGIGAVASGDSFYGIRHMFFILRNEGTGWRILQMNPDARMPALGSDSYPSLLRTFDNHILNDRMALPPPAAVLVEPLDRAVLTRFPRPQIVWRSEADTDARFIVESQYAEGANDGYWSASSLDFAQASRAGQQFRQRAPFGVGKQPHRWRVWTLGPSGAVSLSSWRTVLFSN